MRRLVLLDIDGTILTAGGAAARAFRRTLEEVFGTSGPASGYSFGGRTDPQIARDLLRLAGLDEARIETGLERVWPRYLELLAGELRTATITVLPGVAGLIERLHAEPGALLGLLTGNVREGARMKLEAAGIDFDHFQVGAYGSDHADRRELPALAVARAEERFGHRFEGKSIVIVGDTPHDIACGAHLDVRTLAVATGSYPLHRLAECGPDYLLPSLEDTETVWRAIFD